MAARRGLHRFPHVPPPAHAPPARRGRGGGQGARREGRDRPHLHRYRDPAGRPDLAQLDRARQRDAEQRGGPADPAVGVDRRQDRRRRHRFDPAEGREDRREARGGSVRRHAHLRAQRRLSRRAPHFRRRLVALDASVGAGGGPRFERAQLARSGGRHDPGERHAPEGHVVGQHHRRSRVRGRRL